MRILVAVVALAVLAGTAWFTVGPGASAPVGACSQSTETATATAPGDDALLTRWGHPTVLPVGEEFDQEEILDVASFRDGFVAVGQSTNGAAVRSFFHTSGYGDTWQSALLDARLDGVELRRLRVVGDRIFALGTASTDDRGGSRAAVWFSDDAHRWQPADGSFDEATVTSLAADDEGLLLVGHRPKADAPVAWRSADGAQWTEIDLRLPVDRSVANLTDLASHGGRFVGTGFVSRGPDAASTAVVWASADGVAWTCHVLEAGEDVRAHAWEIHRGPRGWLVVGDGSRGCGIGASCPGFQIVWASVDGTWTTGQEDRMGSPMERNAIYAAGDEGFIAIGGGVWLSETGRGWTLLEGGGPAAGAQAVAIDGTRLAAGGVQLDADGQADAWLAAGLLDR